MGVERERERERERESRLDSVLPFRVAPQQYHQHAC
jgi:hypothetical protein